MKNLRQAWLRSLIISLTLFIAALIFADDATTNSARESASKSLLGATVLFSICSAISIAIFINYVRGLTQAYEDKVSDARDLLEDFFDTHKNSSNPDIQTIIDSYVLPLLSLNMAAWHEFEPVRKILPHIDEPAVRLHKIDGQFLPRYLLRIEDTINQIGILYLHRILSQIHVDNISGTFILIAFGITVFVLSNLLPYNPTINLIVVWLSLSVIAFAIIELLLILSYLKQEAREELPEAHEANDLDDASTPDET